MFSYIVSFIFFNNKITPALAAVVCIFIKCSQLVYYNIKLSRQGLPGLTFLPSTPLVIPPWIDILRFIRKLFNHFRELIEDNDGVRITVISQTIYWVWFN